MDKFEAFLVSLGACGKSHSGRDLYTHLSNTYKILKAWDCPEYVCLGGLFHSIYGTNSFRDACLSIKDRARLVSVIGVDAEELVYLFGTVDRPRAWFEPDKYFLGGWTKALRTIEVANLLEQGYTNPWLLWKLGETDIPSKARQAIARAELDRCWPWIEEALLLYGKTHTYKQIHEMIWSGKATFMPGVKCAMLCRPIFHPSGLRDFHIWAAGGELIELTQMGRAFEEIARVKGFHRITAHGRRGWLRHVGDWSDCGTRICKNLNDFEIQPLEHTGR